MKTRIEMMNGLARSFASAGGLALRLLRAAGPVALLLGTPDLSA